MENPKAIVEAKKIASGPLGRQMSKFPLRFAKAVFFGTRPSKTRTAEINNGTITLVDFGKGPFAITCHHVIDTYRKRREADHRIVFQIGNVELDPLIQLIDENDRIDLATIRLSDTQVKLMTSEHEIGSCVFQPKSWPVPPLKEGDYVAFGGFPGSLKTMESFDEFVFPTWSSGASRVSSVSDLQFVSAFERDYWVSSYKERHHMELRALGGMSGGPAFIHRGIYWDLVGIVSEYHERYDALFFASVRWVRSDGTIERPPV
jgi:hypothetical protein